MKTSELQGAALDWAVAKCEFVGAPPLRIVSGLIYTVEGDNWNPSTDWAQGGPIIEREGLAVWKDNGYWEAEAASNWAKGDTALIAAMRCYVASKMGDDVELPEELK
jgi:hypothetical protein